MKKPLPFLIFSAFLLILFAACEYLPKNKNVISANQNIIDTGLRYIIVQKDTTAEVAPLPDSIPNQKVDSLVIPEKKDTVALPEKPEEIIKVVDNTNKDPKAIAIINFAKTMIGKPYAYGANTPDKGFDNSGFVNYVFNHFNITVPRYAASYIATGNAVDLKDAYEGDIILFSKTDSVKKLVSQVGIIVSPKGAPVSFIHASSGKMNGVGISKLSSYYQKKIMGVRRVF